MKALLKILGGVIGLVILLVAGLAVYFTLFFDPNDYRDQLTTVVKERTGRDLAINGDIGITVFPWLGIELGQVQLGNAQGFGEEPFARIEAAQARVKLMPLLRKEVEIDTVALEGLQLNLARARDGRSNWDDLVPAESAGAAAEEKPAGEPAPAVAALAVGGIELSDARVVWDDRQSGTRQTVENLNLTSGELVPGRPFPVEASLDLTSSAPVLKSHLTFKGEVNAQPDKGRYTVKGLELRAESQGETLPGGKADIQLNAEVDADLWQQTLDVTGLTLTAYGLRMNGALKGGNITTAPLFKGTLEVGEFSPRELLAQLGQPAIDTADGNVLSKASLKSALEATPSRLMLSGLEMRLDDTALTGSAGVSDFASQALRFDLALDAIDLDRYLPPPREGQQAGSPGAAAGAAGIDPAVLRPLNIQGKFHVGSLKIAKLSATDINVEVKAKDGLVQLNPLNAALYEGRYNGDIRLDGRGKVLQLALDEHLKGVQAGPLLRDLTGKEEKITGQAEMNAALRAAGNDAEAMKRTLNGNADFRFINGAIKGVNIAQMLREADARLKGQQVPPSNEPNQTDFSELSGTVKVTDGVARNDDLLAKSPLLRVTGSGSADLPRERIDYLVKAAIVGTLTGQGGKELDQLHGVTVPIKVSGSFDNPKYALDTESLLKEAAQGKIEEKKEEIKQKATEQLQEKLQDGLKGLFR